MYTQILRAAGLRDEGVHIKQITFAMLQLLHVNEKVLKLAEKQDDESISIYKKPLWEVYNMLVHCLMHATFTINTFTQQKPKESS